MDAAEGQSVAADDRPRKREPLWKYLLAGALTGCALLAGNRLRDQDLLLLFQIAVCLPVTIFAVLPRKSRIPRKSLAIIVVIMLAVSIALNLHAILSWKFEDNW